MSKEHRLAMRKVEGGIDAGSAIFFHLLTSMLADQGSGR